MIDLRLAGPAACGWLALVLTLPTPGALPVVATGAGFAGLSALAAAALLHRASRLPRARAALAFAALCLAVSATVCAVAAVHVPLRAPALLQKPVAATLHGVVSEATSSRGDRLRIHATKVTTRSETVRVDLPVLVTGLTPGPARDRPRLHDTVSVSGRLAPAAAGGSLAAFLDAASPVVIQHRAAGVDAALSDLRASLARVAVRLPGDGGALLPGLSVGDTAAVDDSLDAAMTDSGLSHLTAVSGANCAVVVAVVLVALGACGVPRLMRIGGAAAALVGFVALVTPDPSVLRAGVMALVALGLMAAGRPPQGLPMLSLAVVVLLIADPWTARSYSFALSVAATAGLVVLAGPLARLLARVLPEGLALALAIPTAAQLACQPILFTLSPRVPVLSIAANLLAEPVAPVATVLGLAACLLAGPAPSAALVVAGVAWLPSAWIAAVARLVSAVPSGSLDAGDTTRALVVAAVLLVLVGAVVLTTPYRRSRRAAVAALLVVALPLATVATGREVGRRASFPNDWQMVQCDIGQGDANLVRSGGRVALVDTGDDEQLLRMCLALVGVRSLDVLVLTHFDRDHVGASPLLAGRIGDLVVGPSDGPDADRLVASLRPRRVIQAQPGMRLSLGDLALDVLWPPPGTRPGNGASVTLRVGPRRSCPLCITALMLGDLDETAQRRLMGRQTLGRVDVVKVTHHGSRDQYPGLYDAVRARIALIGVGTPNPYGHPTAETLRMLHGAGSEVVRSDLDGTVALSTSPGVPGQPPRITVWKSGARTVSAAAPRLDSTRADAPRVESGSAGPRQVVALDGDQISGRGEVVRPQLRAEGARGDRPARLGPHPAGSGGAGLRSRAVPRRSRDPPAPRPAGR